eukprot:CAMPEP_0177412742 /NCGR_PEP_ID=MMETSP0368-20130122/66144_1 /TAXON_ID=447022 ORGANISM="Scrippsiella hangoei-like, Strain SHHI-4" /NCGR_SAMPLE_ID=MMETSP0368 /ASSEMBLY_ACC=CAM_ASM_000363 /LENGTH=127 /DNA_ID=CAMNT_0018882007 /DNA_START=21 /DNA_END=400 /DNA_ORIENTATION=+
MSAFERGRSWEQAMQLVDGMCARSLEPGQFTRLAMLSSCEKTLQWEAALDIFYGSSRLHFPDPSVQSYNAVVTACEKRQYWKDALATVAEMRRLGVQRSTVTCGAIISACEEGRQWSASMGFLGELR